MRMATERLICLLVVLVSGNIALFTIGKQFVYLGAAAILVLCSFRRGMRVTRRDIAIFAAFLGLSVVHFVTFGDQVLTASLGFMVRLVVAFLGVRLVKDFHRHYVDVMVGLSILSFVFYVPVVLGADLATMLEAFRVPIEGTRIVHVGFHNFHVPEEAMRNSGMFGEPGMFAGYLALAMLFESRSVRVGWKFVVVAAALLTTQSTAGYLAALPIVVLLVFRRQLAKHGKVKYGYVAAGLVPLLAGSYLAYTYVPFLGEKIDHQFFEASEGTEGSEINRIGNVLFDKEYIASRPLAGWSPLNTTRTVVHSRIDEFVDGQGNGLTGFTVKFGLLGVVSYLVAVFGRLRRHYQSALLGGMGLIAIAVMLTGQQFLNGPCFLALMFWDASAGIPGSSALPRSRRSWSPGETRQRPAVPQTSAHVRGSTDVRSA